MARLEYTTFHSFTGVLHNRDSLLWQEEARPPLEKLPQIFWKDGSGWAEANVWALSRRSSPIDIETTKRTMKHLCRYANFLEYSGLDWRHFPVRKEEQVLRKFRKSLLDDVKSGLLAQSTATNCMNAVIQFYRFANLNQLVRAKGPIWAERSIVINFHDTAGFERSIVRLTTDLAIPNRAHQGQRLEDGLLPLNADHMSSLLAYSAKKAAKELHLMLSTGFFTGARVGTITTLKVSTLQSARKDSNTLGMYLLSVGPGTGVSTKFSVSGNILIPEALLQELWTYATSTGRLLREAKASHDDKDRLFLARSGRPYTVETVDRLVNEFRKRATADGLQFMKTFTFHQSRATFGTWLMQLLLDHVPPAVAIRFVRDAMLHKDEKTTMGYITFLDNTRAKSKFAEAFNMAFTGLAERDWNSFDA